MRQDSLGTLTSAVGYMKSGVGHGAMWDKSHPSVQRAREAVGTDRASKWEAGQCAGLWRVLRCLSHRPLEAGGALAPFLE